MIIKENYSIPKVSWLTTLTGDGCAKVFYEPETIEELTELCRGFFLQGLDFDLIGHTSNTLYLPGYCCERMVSTRKLTSFDIQQDCIVCDCGVPVKKISLEAINRGIKGFEGLTDLPGTAASAIYGHATCFDCDISSMLIDAKVLTSDGKVIIVKPEWFEFARRSSSLKRKEKRAVILSVRLRSLKGDIDDLKRIAELNHYTRKASQPEAKNSLGSIFSESGGRTLLNYFLSVITNIYALFLLLKGDDNRQVSQKKVHLIFVLLRARDVEPYVRAWNWYQWKDEKSHELFWKYVHLHKLMFKKSVFEIEIKNNKKK